MRGLSLRAPALCTAAPLKSSPEIGGCRARRAHPHPRELLTDWVAFAPRLPQWMRNGDFAPSRLEAQQDAVTLLAGAKTQSNPENTVGVLTMAGPGVEVRVAVSSRLRVDASSRSHDGAWRRCAGGGELDGRARSGDVRPGRAHRARTAPVV